VYYTVNAAELFTSIAQVYTFFHNSQIEKRWIKRLNANDDYVKK